MILTGSGGPFRGWTHAELAKALAHMGPEGQTNIYEALDLALSEGFPNPSAGVVAVTLAIGTLAAPRARHR